MEIAERLLLSQADPVMEAKNNENIFTRMSVKSGRMKASAQKPPKGLAATTAGPGLSSMLAPQAVSSGASASSSSPFNESVRASPDSARAPRRDGWEPITSSPSPSPPVSAPHTARESRSRELMSAGGMGGSLGSRHRGALGRNLKQEAGVGSAADQAMRYFFEKDVPPKHVEESMKYYTQMESPPGPSTGVAASEARHLRQKAGDVAANTTSSPHRLSPTADAMDRALADEAQKVRSSPLPVNQKEGRVRETPGSSASQTPGTSPETARTARRLRSRPGPGETSVLAEGASRLLADAAGSLSSRSPHSQSEQSSQRTAAAGVMQASASAMSAKLQSEAHSHGTGGAEPLVNGCDQLQGLLGPSLEGPARILRGACTDAQSGTPAASAPTASAASSSAAPKSSSTTGQAQQHHHHHRIRNKPKEISGAFEFKPISRSSSESGSLTASPTSADVQDRGRKGDKKDAAHNDKTRGASITSSIHSDRPSLTTCYVNFDKFDLQIENGRAPTKILTWDQLAEFVPDSAVGVQQAVEWYRWDAPMKFQAVAIPCIVQACRNVGDAKSYTLLQAATGLGKTSSLALAMLASVRREVTALQFIVVGLDACDEMESYINALSRLFAVKVAYFKDREPSGILDAAVEEAQGAQIIVGHPNHVLAVLKASQEQLALQTMEVLLIDDAASLITEGLVQKVCEINQLCSLFAQHPLRYVVVSNFVQNEAKPALRALKSSLMSKKNMFDLSAQVGRIRKFVKHYVLRGTPEGWVQSLVRMRSMVHIPRAVIFCDDEHRFQELKKKFSTRWRGEDGKELTVAIMDSQCQTQDQRRASLAAFCKEQQDFLLTRSEPNIFQSSLPRVFWIIHFGIESTNLSWYGCRLLCLDSTLRQKAGKGPQHEGVSILFLPPEKKDKDKTTVPKLEKMFGVKFEPLPFGDV